MDRLRSTTVSRFKVSGFFLRSEAAQYLAELLFPVENDEDRRKWLTSIISHVQSQGIESLNIEKSHLELAVRDCTNPGLDPEESVFGVISAFEVPRFQYSDDRKKFIRDNSPRSMLPESGIKAKYLRDRYTMLWQRTSRHHLFAPSSDPDKTTFQLRKAEQLLSSSGMTDVVILGLLTQLVQGRFHLEDPSGAVPIDISAANFHSGLFCEGCFVLAEGTYDDGVLKVSGLGFPPPELASSSRAFFGMANSWGGRSLTLLKYSKRLAEIEKKNENDAFVFLSDCWLDVPLVMEKLKTLFEGFDDVPPAAIVLMGPFMKNYDNVYALKRRLAALGELIDATSRLKRETDVVLVPAADDPLAASVLPRPPLPETLTSDLRRKCPRVTFATNPCRLQYCTQQIVVCRSDLVTKFCRNALKHPTSSELADHFARTLICQGTLAPLHPTTIPTFWDFDAALSLYPLPDLIVVGDPSSAFHITQQECTVLNTGSFPKSKFAFKLYLAATRSVEDSELPEE